MCVIINWQLSLNIKRIMEYVLLIRLALFLLFFIMYIEFLYYFVDISSIIFFRTHFMYQKNIQVHLLHIIMEFILCKIPTISTKSQNSKKKRYSGGKLCFWTHLNNHVNDIFCHVYIRQMFVKNIFHYRCGWVWW